MKSMYQLQLKCDANVANNFIQNYLYQNKFNFQCVNGEQYYIFNNQDYTTSWCFNYNITGKTLTIYAWIKKIDKDIKIEDYNENTDYKEILSKLFQEVQKINTYNVNYDPNTGLPVNRKTENMMTREVVTNFGLGLSKVVIGIIITMAAIAIILFFTFLFAAMD